MFPLVSSIARASRLDLFRLCVPSSARYASSLPKSSDTIRFVNDGRWPGPLTKQGLPSMRSGENKARLEELGFNNLQELINSQGQLDSNVGTCELDAVSTKTTKSTPKENSTTLDATVDSGPSSAKVSDPIAAGDKMVVDDRLYTCWLLENGFADASGCFLRWSAAGGVQTLHVYGKQKDVKHCKATLKKAHDTTSRVSGQQLSFKKADGMRYSPIVKLIPYQQSRFKDIPVDAAGSIVHALPDAAFYNREHAQQPMYSRWEVLGSDNGGGVSSSAGSNTEPTNAQTEEIQKQVRSTLSEDSCRHTFVVHARLGTIASRLGQSAVFHAPGKTSDRSRFSPSVQPDVQEGLVRLLPETSATEVNTIATTVVCPTSTVCPPDQVYIILEEILGQSCSVANVFKVMGALSPHHIYNFALPRHQLDVRFSISSFGVTELATEAEKAEVLTRHGSCTYLADGCLRMHDNVTGTSPIDFSVLRRGTKLSKRYPLGNGLVLERGRLHLHYSHSPVPGSVLCPQRSCDFVNVVPEVLAVAASELHLLGQPLDSGEVEQCVDSVPHMLDQVFRLSRGEAPVVG